MYLLMTHQKNLSNLYSECCNASKLFFALFSYLASQPDSKSIPNLSIMIIKQFYKFQSALPEHYFCLTADRSNTIFLPQSSAGEVHHFVAYA